MLGPDGLSRFEELSRRDAARTAILYAFAACCLTNTSPRAGLPFLRTLAQKASFPSGSTAPTSPARAASGSRSAIPPASPCSASGARFGRGDNSVRPSARVLPSPCRGYLCALRPFVGAIEPFSALRPQPDRCIGPQFVDSGLNYQSMPRGGDTAPPGRGNIQLVGCRGHDTPPRTKRRRQTLARSKSQAVPSPLVAAVTKGLKCIGTLGVPMPTTRKSHKGSATGNRSRPLDPVPCLFLAWKNGQG